MERNTLEYFIDILENFRSSLFNAPDLEDKQAISEEFLKDLKPLNRFNQSSVENLIETCMYYYIRNFYDETEFLEVHGHIRVKIYGNDKKADTNSNRITVF